MVYRNLSGSIPWRIFTLRVSEDLFGNHDTEVLNYKANSDLFDLVTPLSRILKAIKKNTVITLSLFDDDKGGHANLLIVDYINKELFLWDPNGGSFFRVIEEKELFEQKIRRCCRANGYVFKQNDGCKSAPQLRERYCAKRINPKGGGGYCASYSMVFGLLYLRSKMNFHDLDMKIDQLINGKDPCAFFSLFTILSDICADWILTIIPTMKEALTALPIEDGLKYDTANEDLLYQLQGLLTHTLVNTDQIVLDATKVFAPLPQRDISLLESQIDLILAQFDEEHTDLCQSEKKRYKELYEKQLAITNDLRTSRLAPRSVPRESKTKRKTANKDKNHKEKMDGKYLYVNPETGRQIKKDGPTYQRLLKIYNEKALRKAIK